MDLDSARGAAGLLVLDRVEDELVDDQRDGNGFVLGEPHGPRHRHFDQRLHGRPGQGPGRPPDFGNELAQEHVLVAARPLEAVDLGDRVELAHDRMERIPKLRVAQQVALHEAHHALEGVLHPVVDFPHQGLAQPLLPLHPFVPGLLVLGQVFDEHEQSLDLPVLPQVGNTGGAGVALRPVPVSEEAFTPGGEARKSGPDVLLDGGVDGLPHDFPDVLADDLPAGDAAPDLIGEIDEAVALPRIDVRSSREGRR